jgi:hypothetical protein
LKEKVMERENKMKVEKIRFSLENAGENFCSRWIPTRL